MAKMKNCPLIISRIGTESKNTEAGTAEKYRRRGLGSGQTKSPVTHFMERGGTGEGNRRGREGRTGSGPQSESRGKCSFMAAKDSALMACSMRQASRTAVSRGTPSDMSQAEKNWWRS